MSLAMCKCIGKADWVLSRVLTLVMETEFVSAILVYSNCLIHLSVQEVCNEFDCCENFKIQQLMNDAERRWMFYVHLSWCGLWCGLSYEDHRNFCFVGYFHGVVASVCPCNSRPCGLSFFQQCTDCMALRGGNVMCGACKGSHFVWKS
jgi:hypothetical protein